MNKKELSEEIAGRTGVSAADAKKSVDALTDIATEQLKKGEELQLTGFGKFAKAENGGTGRHANPVTFSAGRSLKEALS